MPIETPQPVWNALVETVRPFTVADGDIQHIRVELKNGGVTARTVEPHAEHDFSHLFEGDADDRSHEATTEPDENKSVFIHEDVGLKLKKLVIQQYNATFAESRTIDSDIQTVMVSEDTITSVFAAAVSLDQSASEACHAELADALVTNEQIDKPSQFAYGEIRKARYNAESDIGLDGWEFDGTLHRYTDKPYEWWTEPTNIDEWAEFASDTPAGEEHTLSKDEHVVHFHPMEHGLDESNPYIQWFKRAETQFQDAVETVENTSPQLSRVSVDPVVVRLFGTVAP